MGKAATIAVAALVAAVIGALWGMVLGPVGAVVGAALGLLVSLCWSYKHAAQQEKHVAYSRERAALGVRVLELPLHILGASLRPPQRRGIPRDERAQWHDAHRMEVDRQVRVEERPRFPPGHGLRRTVSLTFEEVQQPSQPQHRRLSLPISQAVQEPEEESLPLGVRRPLGMLTPRLSGLPHGYRYSIFELSTSSEVSMITFSSDSEYYVEGKVKGKEWSRSHPLHHLPLSHLYQQMGEELLAITRQARIFDFMSTLGFKLSVPENCLPPGLETGAIHVTCCISTSNALQFPPFTEPVSALYHIQPDFSLWKPVTLELEHCNSDEDSVLQLVRADEIDQIFQRIERDVEMTETHVSVELQDFSWFTIIAERFRRRRYCGVVYHTSISITEEQYDFVFMRHLHALTEFVRQQMEKESSNTRTLQTFSEVTFSRDSQEIALDVSVEGVKTDEGWLVFPNPHPARVTHLQGIAPVQLPPVLPQPLLIPCEQVQLLRSEPATTPDSRMLCFDDLPTIENLLRFRSKNGHINILERIGINYKSFGVFLLEDSQGEVVARLERDHPRVTLEVCRQILQMWIRGRGKKPTSWNTLIACLRDTELNALADDIKNSLVLKR